MSKKPADERKKKAIRWDHDLNILTRLEVVSSMLTQGAKAHQIAEALSYSLRTAHRDIDRVYVLWRRESVNDVIAMRDRSIAQYRSIQTQAWAEWRATKKISWLRIAMDAEEKVSELQGTKKIALDLTSKGERMGGASAKDLTDDQLAAIILSKVKK